MPEWWRGHALEWFRAADRTAVDLHRTLVGARADPERVWQVLATCPARQHLTSLHVAGNDINGEGLGQLDYRGNLAALRRLNLAGTSFTDAGIRALAQSPLLAQLVDLDLGQTDVTTEGVRILLDSPHAA